jgi:hypothetical protein
MRFICVLLIIEALHGKDGHVGKAPEPPHFRLVNSLLDIIFIIDAATAIYT